MSDNSRAKLSMNIKGIAPTLFEAGKVKIGRKGKERPAQSGGTYQAPEKLDHFLITRTNRGLDNNFVVDDPLMELLEKDADNKIRRIPITLLYDDLNLNFQSRFACYVGRTLFCSGDGETANQGIRSAEDPKKIGGYKSIPCPCHKSEFGYTGKDKCKMTGRLQFLIRGAERLGGVHIFRTTGRNSVVAIMSSLALIQRVTNGILAGIPLDLVVSPKHVIDPDGKPQTVYLVAIEFAGSMQALQDQAHKFLLGNEQHRLQIHRIEEEARILLTANPAPFAEDLDEDSEGDEFFPKENGGSELPAESGTIEAPQSLADGMARLKQSASVVKPVQPEPQPTQPTQPAAEPAKPIAQKPTPKAEPVKEKPVAPKPTATEPTPAETDQNGEPALF